MGAIRLEAAGGGGPDGEPPAGGAAVTGREDRDLLRFVACGSVDDGKSTLIGRLLFEAGEVPEDQLAALAVESRKWGTQGDAPDYALLLDGLNAEREQGITIDVAYRYFSTPRRNFIVADTPGHEQYTRNMVTGASTASLAVILVDAAQGLLTQTRRHSHVVALLGIRHVVLAVNKLDLVAYSPEVFAAIERDYRSFAAGIGLADVTCIPLSALNGDNLTSRSQRTPWYAGPTLLEHLEAVPVATPGASGPLRLVVQWVNRPDARFRGYSGRIVGGRLRPGQPVRILPSGRLATVARIVTADGDLPEAATGRSVTVTLDEDVDVGRGDLLAAADAPAQVADQFETTVVWMSEEPLLAGRSYLLKIGARTVGAVAATPKYRVNVDTLERLAARTLQANDIGVVNLALDQPVAFDPYTKNRDTGGGILIDRLSSETVGAVLFHFALRRSQNLHWQAQTIDKAAHALRNGQRPCVVWFTGLSGAGKSTIANALERELYALGRHTYLLDGDNVRHGLNRDLGFTEADRVENIRRVAEVARLMVDAGLIVLVSFISPFAAERRAARARVAPGEFCEVFVDVPLAVAEARDTKGLYAKARRGELVNFTGIDSPYERPEAPEITIDAAGTPVDEAVARVVAQLRGMGVLGRT